MLIGMGLKAGNPQWSHDVTNVPLADTGITKMQSDRWQQEAAK